MDIEQTRTVIEAELLDGARRLRKARAGGTRYRVGYWRAYVESRERFLMMLDSMHDEE